MSDAGMRTDEGTTATSTKSASLWEDFIDVFTNPSGVFDRRRSGQYGGGVALYATISALVFVATRAFWQPFFDRQFELAFAAQRAAGKLTPEQIDQARAVGERFGQIGIWFAGTVGPAIAVMVVALLVLLAGLAASARVTYGQALVIATLAYIPRILANIAGAGVLAVKDVTTLAAGVIPTSPAALLGPNVSPIVAGLLGRFDPFVLWSTVLIGIGVSVLARVSRSKGFTVAGLVWTIATLGALLSGLRAAAAAAG